MVRPLVLVASLVLAVYLYLDRFSAGPSLTVSDTAAVRDTGELRVNFERRSRFAETFMIFGGNLDRRLHNSFSDVSLAALGMEDASRIHDTYPDFHMCKSAGAPIAQKLTRTLYLNAGDQSIMGTLKQSLALHSDRLAGNGERTCIALEGDQIELSSVTHEQTTTDVSNDVIPRLRHMDFYLIDYAEIVDCGSLL